MIADENSRSPKVLVVDDDIVSRRFVEQLLQREGYTTIPAVSGLEGVKAAFCQTPDIIIMDVMMEGIDGLAAIRAARQALIDAVAVGLVFHNEDPRFGTGRLCHSNKNEDRWEGDEFTHNQNHRRTCG